jgi:hypothetical protein
MATNAEKRAKRQAEIESYGDESGTSYRTLMSLKNDPSDRLQRAVVGGGTYGTELSSGALDAREKAAAFGKLGSIDSDKAKKAGREAAAEERREARGMAKGGKVSSASSRADGCAVKGKTKGRFV